MKKLIFVIWGSGIRRIKVDPDLYEPISKIGRYYLYQRIKGKRLNKVVKKKRTKRKITKRDKFVAKVKGIKLVSPQQLRKEKETEKRLLSSIKLLPTINKRDFAEQINPKKIIMSNGRQYESYSDLDKDKKDIYLSLMDNLVKAKNQKFRDKMFSLRKMLLQDGIVIEVDLYGTFSQKGNRVVNLGTLHITGLMIEDADFIETDIVGSSGTIGEIERVVDGLTRGKGGAGARISKTPLKFDSTQIYITNVKIRLNYA